MTLNLTTFFEQNPRIKYWLRLAVLIGLGALLIVASVRHYHVTITLQQDSIPGDFAIFWLLGRMAQMGLDLYDMPLGRETYIALIETPGSNWFSTRWLAVTHPPSEAVVFYPFSRLPWETARPIWVALIHAIWIGVVGWLSFDIWRKTTNLIKAGAFACLAMLFIPAQFSLQIGQLDIPHLAGMLAAVYFLKNKNSIAAGAIIGFLATTKPTPVLLLGLFLIRLDWRAIASACAAAFVVMGTSVLWLGIDPWLIWLGEVLPELTNGSTYFGNATFTGVGYQLFADPVAWQTYAPPPGLTRAETFARLLNWSALIGLVAVVWNYGRDMNASRITGVFWLFVIYILLTGKVAWSGYFVWVLPAFTFLLNTEAKQDLTLKQLGYWGLLLIAYVLIWLPPRYYQLPDAVYTELWVTRLLIPLKVYGTLILAGLVVLRLRKIPDVVDGLAH